MVKMNDFEPTTTVSVVSEQVSCDLAGEAAILNMKNGKYYTLNPVGARIWSLLQTPTSVGSISDVIMKEYEVDRELCEADVKALLLDLAANDLLQIH